MGARTRRLIRAGLMTALLPVFFGFGPGSPGIKVRVKSDGAPIKATAEVFGQNLTTVPLDTVLDAEPKQGQWYKVTLTKDGVPLVGYIHEMNVKEITEAEAQQALGPTGRVKPQAEIVAEIEFNMEADKRLIRQGKEPDKAVNDLMPLLAKAFSIDDRQKQRQIACELYLWIGQAYEKKGDKYAALKEFKNMIDVDRAYAREITKNISDPSVSGLLEHAEKLSNGLITDYGLQITTQPKEAALKIDGKPIGASPAVFRSIVPKFTLEIDKEGYKPIKEDLFVMEAMTSKDYVLESLGRNLAVASQPKGARVFVDGKDSGKLTDCELPFVSYGSHAVKIVRDNYAPWEGSVQIAEGTGPVPLAVTLAVNTYVFGRSNGAPESKFFKLPRAIAFDQEGSFFIGDESGYRIKKFDNEGRFRASWGDAGRETKVLEQPSGIAVDAAGNVYATDAGDCCVAKFDKNGKFLKKWGGKGARPNELSGPAGIAVDASGNLYVADWGNHRVVKYGPDGALKKIWGKQGIKPGEFVFPAGVAVGPKNEIFVVDRIRLQKFSPEGESLGSWAGFDLKVPLGVCTDALGYVYIADTGNKRILKLDPDGKLICQWGEPGSADGQFTEPVGVAVSSKGSVFVLERENQRFQEFRIPEK